MQELIERARQRTRRERHLIAIAVSGVVVALIFVVWTTTFLNRIASHPYEQEAGTVQDDTTFMESLKRKTRLLFGNTGILDHLNEPVEYKKEEINVTPAVEEDFGTSTGTTTTGTSTNPKDFIDIIKEDEISEIPENR